MNRAVFIFFFVGSNAFSLVQAQQKDYYYENQTRYGTFRNYVNGGSRLVTIFRGEYRTCYFGIFSYISQWTAFSGPSETGWVASVAFNGFSETGVSNNSLKLKKKEIRFSFLQMASISTPKK